MENCDCVIALSFGYAGHQSKIDINKELAKLAASFELPIIAQEEVSAYLSVVEPVSGHGKYIDTWAVLLEAQRIMKKHSYNKPILVAHSAHVKRASQQATMLKINFAIAKGLPIDWDKHSGQWWTRSSWQWRVHELATTLYLRIVNKI